ncbi:MAG: tripartite tricarboxylate transporter substrate binding protein [Rhizobacter sp.]
MNRRAWLLLVAAGPVVAALPPALRLIVAYPPGGLSDDAARRLAQALEPLLQGPVQVEHRPGAAGLIALDTLARARPDGHTLCYSAITPLFLQPRAIEPVIAVLETPALLVATPTFTGRTLADVVAQARAAPGRLRWATSGVGTTGHRVLTRVQAAAGITLTHVPYTGGGHQVNDALAGQFELLLTNAGPLQRAHLAAGRLRALAVGSPKRLDALPDVPTFAEAGFPTANLASVFGVFAPAGTPRDVVDRLNAALATALASPPLQRHFEAAGSTVLGGTAAAFAARVKQEAEQVRGTDDAQPLSRD